MLSDSTFGHLLQYAMQVLGRYPLEAELTKYMHNVFGAYKVTNFNACREYCEQIGADWRTVHTGMLLSGYINDTHTYVPGPASSVMVVSASLRM